ncbi:FecCD family ABC transporter permease [Azospirillum picis]|uniref:Iron complex transport system permease protein n=1 Tax=Azospirillum picis TaxID=488438 RepID=A0ABU0MI13_9PROT|nr:iron ABC transporter permease [Azospirillum picis]MBP2299272.1 iron complex transport system permease protein [Azospirillum picis]MDQ0533090.1 iron complex transport system permease protein [Azospirillum picis]
MRFSFPLPLALGLLLLAAALAGLSVGSVAFGPGELLSALAGGGDPRIAAILIEIRLPRVLLGIEVGAALGLSGAALQGLLRNPLAEPGLLGVSSCAGRGAVVAFYFGLAALSPLALPGMALAGALAATGILLAVAARAGPQDGGSLTLILSGIALSSLSVALTSLALNLAPNPYAVTEMLLWLMGSLKDRTPGDALLALPFILAGGGMLLAAGRGLDALSLGEDTARSLGVDLLRLRLLVVGGTAAAVGAAVSVSGSIGFVGLVVPHLLRPLVGHEPGRLLLPSALGGAVLVTLADLAIRLIPTPQEVMLGVVTALIGAPFFLTLILRLNREVP